MRKIPKLIGPIPKPIKINTETKKGAGSEFGAKDSDKKESIKDEEAKLKDAEKKEKKTTDKVMAEAKGVADEAKKAKKEP